MEQRLKQRLIGAAVLVALAVIFIPMLLTGPVERVAGDVPLNIPPVPTVEPAPTEVAEVPETQAPQPMPVYSERQVGADLEPTPRAAPIVTQAPPAPKPDAATAAWTVQVGSFGSQTNALGLRDKLRAAGFSAYVEAPQAADGRFYRVRVGPLVERDEAERLKERLEREQALNGLVVSHP